MLTLRHLAPTVALAGLLAGNLCCGGASQAAPPAAAPAVEERAATPAPESPATQPDPSATLRRFLALGRGDQLADLGAGAGYSLLPLASAVGPYGRIYARHAPKVSQHLPSNAVYETPAESLPANIVLLATPLEAPFTPEVKELDAVTFLFGYGELVTAGRDRARLNAAVLRALKPGGVFVIAEHASSAGASERVIRAEVESAGFRFVEAADSQSAGIEEGAGSAGPASVWKFQKAP